MTPRACFSNATHVRLDLVGALIVTRRDAGSEKAPNPGWRVVKTRLAARWPGGRYFSLRRGRDFTFRSTRRNETKNLRASFPRSLPRLIITRSHPPPRRSSTVVRLLIDPVVRISEMVLPPGRRRLLPRALLRLRAFVARRDRGRARESRGSARTADERQTFRRHPAPPFASLCAFRTRPPPPSRPPRPTRTRAPTETLV